MVGRAVTLFPKVESPVGDVLLEVERPGAAARPSDDVSLLGPRRARSSAWPGSSAPAGPRSRGSCSASTGATPARSGWAASPCDLPPSDALSAGIAYVPEDRHQDGLVLDFSIAENVTLPILPRLFPRLFVRGRRARRLADRYAKQFSVRATGVDQEVSALSGGNQQKVVLAKWLATDPRVLILDEPTRGIDIGAKVEVHRMISELAAAGLGDHPHLERPAGGPRDVRPDPRDARGPDLGRDLARPTRPRKP